MKAKYHVATFLILFARLSSSSKYYLLAPKAETHQHDKKGLTPDKNNDIYIKIKVSPDVVITPLEVRQLKISEKHKRSRPRNTLCRGPVCMQKLLQNYAYENPIYGSKYMRSQPVQPKKRYADSDSDTTYDSESDVEFNDLTRIKNPLTKSSEVFARELKGANRFSTDYLDISDLKRTVDKQPKLYVTKDNQWEFDKSDSKSQAEKKKRQVFIGNNARRSKYYLVRTSDSERSESASEEVSDEYVKRKLKKKKLNKKYKTKKQKKQSSEESKQESDESVPKRFEVIDNEKKKNAKLPYKIFSEEKSFEISNEISQEVKPKKKKKHSREVTNEKTESYIQGGGRIHKEGVDDSRRRLPHFLPKNYYWDPDDFHKLGYFWFNGPQGKNAGPWRISY